MLQTLKTPPAVKPDRWSPTSVHTEESPVDRECKAPDASDFASNAALGAFRHSGWTRLRNRVFAAFLFNERLHALAERHQMPEARKGSRAFPVTLSRVKAFSRCGQDAWVLQNKADPTRFRVTSSKCHDRFCLPCCNDRANAAQAKLLDKMKGVLLRFVTLTLRSDDEPLQQQLDRLYASFRKLRQRAFWKRRVKGGIAFVEVKWSAKGKRWHPHLHVMVHGMYLPKKDLGHEWYRVTGDSWIVDVRKVADETQAAKYVAKYATKGYDASAVGSDDRLHEAILAFHGRRFVIAFGDWKGFSLTATDAQPGWRIFDRLDSVLAMVRRGDPNACRILAFLRPNPDDELLRHLTPEPDARPPPLTYAEQQGRLWASHAAPPTMASRTAWASA